MSPSRPPRVLFATPVLQHPPAGGPALRIENSIKALHRVSELTVYARISEREVGGGSASACLRRHCRRLVYSPHTLPEDRVGLFMRRAVNYVSKRVLGRDLCEVKYRGPREDFDDLITLARKLRPDVIWLGYGNISYPLLRHLKDRLPIPVVLDTDSVWSRFVLRALDHLEDPALRAETERKGREKEAEEAWGTRLADVTTAVSEVDAAYYRGLTGDPSRVMIFSNVIDLESYARLPARHPSLRQPSIYLAGSFFPNSPMEQAARWVLREVWPVLRRAVPELSFHIVGRDSDRFLADVREPGVTVHGGVRSVLPLLAHADVVLVPLKFESGTRFKILEAGACRKAVVSTTLGAEGLPVRDGEDILLADDAGPFAEAVLRLLREPGLAERLGGALWDQVAGGFAIDRLVQEAEAVLERVLRTSEGNRP